MKHTLAAALLAATFTTPALAAEYGMSVNRDDRSIDIFLFPAGVVSGSPLSIPLTNIDIPYHVCDLKNVPGGAVAVSYFVQSPDLITTAVTFIPVTAQTSVDIAGVNVETIVSPGSSLYFNCAMKADGKFVSFGTAGGEVILYNSATNRAAHTGLLSNFPFTAAH